MTARPSTEEVLRQHLAKPSSGWSIGTYGAIAEFLWDEDETLLVRDADGLSLYTARGGLRIVRPDRARPVAYESFSTHRDRWTQGIALCLPEGEAARDGRRHLTDLGPDADALRDGDRDAVLFDLGLAVPHVDACVRTADPALVIRLRAACGRPILEPGNPALAAILAESPHRVFVSRLGRIEVFQPIPGSRSDTAGLAGPHTHFLPDLLAQGQTHRPGTPIPEGYRPCLELYPANPLVDRLGCGRAFDAGDLRDFQALLEAWGGEAYLAEKARLTAAVRTGTRPEHYAPPADRAGLTGLRVALRQLAQTDAALPMLGAWREAFDAPNGREARP